MELPDKSSTGMFTLTRQSPGFTDDASNSRKYPVSCSHEEASFLLLLLLSKVND